MAKTVDKLSPIACRNAKPGRHWDGAGLYLEVTPQGSRYWRWKYRYAGTERRLALGTFPEVSLADAREATTAARAVLRQGLDPGAERKQAKADRIAAAEHAKRGTFAAVAAEWMAHKGKTWATETRRKAEFVMATYLLPKLGALDIATLATPDVAPALTALAAKAPNLARKARQYVGGVARYAKVQGLRSDTMALSLEEVIPKFDKGHIPAMVDPMQVGQLIHAIRGYPAPVTRAALLWCAYTAQRPGVVAALRWDEIRGDHWAIPGEKMKMKRPHVVSLPKQALVVLEEMKAYTAGRDYVFPPLARQSTPHLHRDSLSKALRTLGFAGQHATHGFRSMLRTVARERLGIAEDVLEVQLAHAKKGEVQKAYDRTQFIEQRRRAMQRWADYLDALANGGGTVTPIRRMIV